MQQQYASLQDARQGKGTELGVLPRGKKTDREQGVVGNIWAQQRGNKGGTTETAQRATAPLCSAVKGVTRRARRNVSRKGTNRRWCKAFVTRGCVVLPVSRVLPNEGFVCSLYCWSHVRLSLRLGSLRGPRHTDLTRCPLMLCAGSTASKFRTRMATFVST